MILTSKLSTREFFYIAEDPKRILSTVGFPALQFNTANKQFVAARKVPKAVLLRCTERSFAPAKKIEKPSFDPLTARSTAIRLQCSECRPSFLTPLD